MPKIKYAVWFHGNEEESEGICYCGREPYIVDDKSFAEQHMQDLRANSYLEDEEKFSICTIVIDDLE